MKFDDLQNDEYEERCIQEDYVKYCHENTPEKFVKGIKPTAFTVGELIEFLKELPERMIVESSFSPGVQLVVVNFKHDPHLEMMDVSEDDEED